MGAAAIIAGTLGVFSGLNKMGEQSDQEEAAEQAIHLQEQRATMQADQMQIQRAKKESWVLGEQKAMAAARGESQASGSFGAVAEGSAASYVTDSNIARTNLNWQLSDMDSRISQYRDTLQSEHMGDLIGMGESVANLFGGGPQSQGDTAEAKSFNAWNTDMSNRIANPLGDELDNYLGNKQYEDM